MNLERRGAGDLELGFYALGFSVGGRLEKASVGKELPAPCFVFSVCMIFIRLIMKIAWVLLDTLFSFVDA